MFERVDTTLLQESFRATHPGRQLRIHTLQYPFQISRVEISGGIYDIEYVCLGNVILAAWARHPLGKAGEQIQIHLNLRKGVEWENRATLISIHGEEIRI